MGEMCVVRTSRQKHRDADRYVQRSGTSSHGGTTFTVHQVGYQLYTGYEGHASETRPVETGTAHPGSNKDGASCYGANARLQTGSKGGRAEVGISDQRGLRDLRLHRRVRRLQSEGGRYGFQTAHEQAPESNYRRNEEDTCWKKKVGVFRHEDPGVLGEEAGGRPW